MTTLPKTPDNSTETPNEPLEKTSPTGPRHLVGLVCTYNQGVALERLLASLHRICDHVIVVDAGSTDTTLTVAQQAGAQVVLSPTVLTQTQDPIAQVQAGLAAAKAHVPEGVTPWLLWLNPFEWLNEASQQELLSWKKPLSEEEKPTKQAKHGYTLTIQPQWQGHTLRYGKLSRPELRLIRLEIAKIVDHPYFEGIEIDWRALWAVDSMAVMDEAMNTPYWDGKQGADRYEHLSHACINAEPYANTAELLQGIHRLADRSAQYYWAQFGHAPSQASPLRRFFAPIAAFIRQYWGRGSYKDGSAGLTMAYAQALQTYLKVKA